MFLFVLIFEMITSKCIPTINLPLDKQWMENAKMYYLFLEFSMNYIQPIIFIE